MKSSVIPFLVGGMTVFSVWVMYNNRKALDKLVSSATDTTEQAIQKFKAKLDSMNCCQDEMECK